MMSDKKKKKFAFTTAKSVAKNNNELEKYFELQRAEHEAARSIQRIWRSSRVLLPWRHAVLCQKMAQRIQRVVRGVLARKWVAEWFYTRNGIVVTWQAHSRKYTSNLHIRPILAMEKKMATKIQCMVRRRLARHRCNNILRCLMATRIQAMWRGVTGRLFTDKLWLQQTVIPIQNMYRKRLAQRRFTLITQDFFQAAVRIQKVFRNWYSRRILAERLFAREMKYRYNQIQMLTSEEELGQEFLTKSMERLIKNNFKEGAEKALKAVIECEQEVYKQENDLTEYRRQSEILSARAKSQGYAEELARNIVDTRQRVTDAKIKALFELAPEVHKADELLEDQVREIEDWAALRNRVSAERNEQYEERRHLNYKRDILARQKARRIAVAEEKRRWQVLYYTSDGKPDKKRRPGRPWDPSIYAGGNKATYSGGGGVNLMAHIEQARNQATGEHKPGSVKSVEKTLNQVGLQTFLEEVNLYEQLLEPIAKVMRDNMGVTPMGTSALAANGYGSEGVKAMAAFHTVGSIASGITPASPSRGVEADQASSSSNSNNNIGMSTKQHGHNPDSKSLALVRSASDTFDSPSRRRLRAPSADTAAFGSTGGGGSNNNRNRVTGARFQEEEETAAADEEQDEWLDLNAGGGRAGFTGASVSSSSSQSFEKRPTPLQQLREVKERKRAARKSYLPALDAHSALKHLHAHQAADDLSTFVGDIRNMERLSQKFKQRKTQAVALVKARVAEADAASVAAGASVKSRKAAQLDAEREAIVEKEEQEKTYWEDVHKAEREEREKLRREALDHHRAKKRNNVRSSTINWELMDEIDGAKRRWENQRNVYEFNHKY
mmetsp:Transcript_10608/g.17292  ORF Transcript_10608/g.17292 Transcript_10608/m.17292 type:complete len:836 (+) Transcript_10608:127-2634(+)